MFARMISFEVRPDRLEELVAFFEACIVPAAEKQAGFAGVLLLTDEAGGIATSVSLWRTQEEMKEFATNCVAKVAVEFAPFLLAPPRVEVRTVRLQADARPAPPVLYFAETSLGIRVPNPGDG